MEGQRPLTVTASPEGAIPLSLLGSLRAIWSQVLFPGKTEKPGNWRWGPFLLLLVLPGVLLYPCLSFYLFEPDEGRYAQIPREMLERGEWLVPYLQGEPYLDKPPLFYWLVMMSFQVSGVADWSARLVPALAVHGCILLVYLFGRRSLGQRAAFGAGLALTLAPGLLGLGRLLILDGLLTFLVTLSIFAAWEAQRGPRLVWRWWLLAAGACGLAVLTKGPVAVILLAPPLWLHRRLLGLPGLGFRPVAVFAGIVLLVNLPWYAAVCLRLPEFGTYFLWEHNIMRFLVPFAHNQPVWYYVPIMLAGFLPGTLLAIPWARYLLSSDAATRRGRSPELGFMLLTAGWCVFFFSLSDCKLPTYVLPAFPFFALAFGTFLAQTRWHRSRLVAGGAVCGMALTFISHLVVVPRIAWARSPMNCGGDIRAYCGEPTVPVVCYPRPVDSVAFYVGRSDLRSFRSKQTPLLIQKLQESRRTVVLFSHRHSLSQLRDALPAGMRMTHEMKLGLCDMAVVERVDRAAIGPWARKNDPRR